MKETKVKSARYVVQAKRKYRNEDWSEWITVDSYEKAEGKAKYVEQVGYLSRIIVK